MTEADPASSFKLFGTLIVKDQGGGRQQGAKEESSSSPSPPPSQQQQQQQEAEPTPAEPGAAAAAARGQLPCPRCKSKKTKFCYFNNYNVNQPRHFCKACLRYWTAGGALRNVPSRPSAHRRAAAGAGSAGRRRRRLTDPVSSTLINCVDAEFSNY